MFIKTAYKSLSAIARRLMSIDGRLLLIVLLIALAVAVKIAPQFTVHAIPVLVTVAAIISLVRHLLSCRWPRRRRMLRVAARFARNVRTVFAVSWEVEILQASVLLMFFVLLLFYLFWPKVMISVPWWLQLTGVLFSIAGALDLIRVAIAIAKFTWARWTWKAFYAGVVAFSIWAGDVLSQKYVALATRLDPKHFETTERLIHWIVSPLIGIGVVVSALFVLTSLAYFAIMLLSMGAHPLLVLRSSLGTLLPQSHKGSLIYRFRNGKSKVQGQPSGERFWDDAIVWMRPVAMSMAGFVTLWGLGRIQDLPMSTVGPFVRNLVVAVEFNEGQKCGEKIVAEPIDHLEKGKIAIAVRNGHDWELKPGACDLEK